MGEWPQWIVPGTAYDSSIPDEDWVEVVPLSDAEALQEERGRLILKVVKLEQDRLALREALRQLIGAVDAGHIAGAHVDLIRDASTEARAALSEYGLSEGGLAGPANPTDAPLAESDEEGDPALRRVKDEAAASAGREPAERETLPMNPNEEAK